MKTHSTHLAQLIGSGAAVLLMRGTAPALAKDDTAFNWSITPYLWGTDTAGDLTFRDSNTGSGKVSFGESKGTSLARAHFGYAVGERKQTVFCLAASSSKPNLKAAIS
ncbi:hypothetical protein LPB19_09455 [Marinobacter salinisoli]|uniref:Uncharacterized protein n=1 Tax=Marinobacter salinisoli TaxID=2769486 RepID=A0ABX7MT86_9GAMM|nr:hypothetical protein [Marinobacter salinisoli]QSP93453.1 hypothetical protein LPB19_09455 [Marinobacter salinisoli]